MRNLSLLAFVCLGTLPFAAVPARGQSVVGSVPTVNSPAGIGVDPVANKVYVAAQSAVQVINETTHAVITQFNLPTEWVIADVKANPANGRIYVGTENGGLWVMDPKTYLPTALINVNAAGIAINPLTNKIYISDFEGTVYVVDGATNNIDAAIPVTAVQNIAVNPFTNRIYAAKNLFPGKVAVIDGKTNQVTADVAGGGDLSFDVVVDPLHNTFYSTDEFGTVSVFDGKTNTLTATVSIAGEPTGISVDPLTRNVYVVDTAANVIDILNGNTNQVSGTIAVGSSPLYADFDPARGLLFVGNTGQSANYVPGSESVSVLKTR